MKSSSRSLAWASVVLAVTALAPLHSAWAGASSSVVFSLSDYSAQPGDSVNASVRVSGFSQVTTAQFSLQWDSQVLQFVGVGGFGVSGLGVDNFNTSAGNALAMSWDDPAGAGVTVNDGTVLFTASFRVVGSQGSSSPLALADVPTQREVSSNFELVSFISNNGHVEIPLAPVAAIGVSPGSQNFGSVAVGSTSERTFNVSNTGGGTLTGSASVSGPFSIVSGGSYSLGPGESQAVVVRYTPTLAQSDSANVIFTGGGGASVGVSGSAYVSSAIGVSPGSQNFGSVAVGSASERTFNVSNTGGGTLTGSASVSGPFSIVSGGSYSLGPGESQAVVVRYTPTLAQSDSANVIFTGGAGASVGVSGSAYVSTAIGVSPGSQNFGSVAVGSASERTFYVSNAGGGTLSGSASVNGPFSILSGGNYSLGPNESQAVVVRYTPTTAQSDSANVIFTGGGGASVSVSGSAYVSTAIGVSPGSQNFGSVTVGSVSERTFYVSNTGGGTLSGSASVNGPFSIVSGGSYNLGPNESQAVVVRYTPTTAQSDSANVIFTGGGGASVGVSGSAYVSPVIGVSPGTQDYGSVQVGSVSERTFYVSNTGGGTLSGSASVNGPFSIVSGGTYNLGPNESQAVVVRYSPGQSGAHSGSVTCTGGGGAIVSLSGSAYDPPSILISPASQSFGNVLAGTTAERTFYVTNNGGGTLSGSASVSAPFSIVSGDSYNLGANQGQAVVVRYSPGQSGKHTGIITFTGSGGASAAVSGLAYDPPSIVVSPGSQSFGSILVGTTAERTFYVTNSGGGTLSGSASVSAPFSIVSGDSYSLGANQGQAVVVRYSPGQSGSHTAIVSFSGAAGASASLSGSAALPNSAPILPIQPNWTIAKLASLIVTNTASDSEENLLSYTLLDAPSGAAIDLRGVIRWTPSEAVVPGLYSITTRVTDDGTPTLSATNVIQITVIDSPGTFAFSASEYHGQLGSAFNPAVTVTRQQGFGGAVTVRVTPQELAGGPGSLTSVTTPLELRFAEGDTALAIPAAALTKFALRMQRGSFKLVLSLPPGVPAGARIGAVSEAVVYVETIDPPVTEPHLESLSRPVDGTWHLRFTGPTGQEFELQSSDDLLNWITVETVVLANGEVEFTESFRNSRARFYRAKMK